MSVTAIGDYVGIPADAEANFAGDWLLFILFDGQILYGAPFAFRVSPDTKLGDLVKTQLAYLLRQHPGIESLDWDRVIWSRGDGRDDPVSLDSTLRENGLKHKSLLRFRTAQ